MDQVADSSPVLFTGIVVTCNESTRLSECLKSLSFCDQLIVVDLGSADACIKIAREHGAQVIEYPRTPIVEHVRAHVIEEADNDWLIFLDPDEVFPSEIEPELVKMIKQEVRAGSVLVPWKFFFKNSRLDCTFWGAINSKEVVIHRRRVKLNRNVHHGYELLDGFERLEFSLVDDHFIRHYWMDSYHQLFEKHIRYIRHEGESRFNQGERFSWQILANGSPEVTEDELSELPRLSWRIPLHFVELLS